jgi:hypothetical protein
MQIDSLLRYEVVNNRKHPVVTTERAIVMANLIEKGVHDRLAFAWVMAWHIARTFKEPWSLSATKPVTSEAEAWALYAKVGNAGKAPSRTLHGWVSEPGSLTLGTAFSSQVKITSFPNSPGSIHFAVHNRGAVNDIYLVGSLILVADALMQDQSPFIARIGDALAQLIEEAFYGAARRFSNLAEYAAKAPRVHELQAFRAWGDGVQPVFDALTEWDLRNRLAVVHSELASETKRLGSANEALKQLRSRCNPPGAPEPMVTP